VNYRNHLITSLNRQLLLCLNINLLFSNPLQSVLLHYSFYIEVNPHHYLSLNEVHPSTAIQSSKANLYLIYGHMHAGPHRISHLPALMKLVTVFYFIHHRYFLRKYNTMMFFAVKVAAIHSLYLHRGCIQDAVVHKPAQYTQWEVTIAQIIDLTYDDISGSFLHIYRVEGGPSSVLQSIDPNAWRGCA